MSFPTVLVSAYYYRKAAGIGFGLCGSQHLYRSRKEIIWQQDRSKKKTIIGCGITVNGGVFLGPDTNLEGQILTSLPGTKIRSRVAYDISQYHRYVYPYQHIF